MSSTLNPNQHSLEPITIRDAIVAQRLGLRLITQDVHSFDQRYVLEYDADMRPDLTDVERNARIVVDYDGDRYTTVVRVRRADCGLGCRCGGAFTFPAQIEMALKEEAYA